MATLEKIRQKKKILAIVIGAALLAFIIEVGIEAMGRMSGNSAVAKVGSEKIDVVAFQNRVQKETSKDQNNAGQQDAAVKQQQVLEQMISEKLLNKEYEKTGIDVTSKEISEMMIGKKPAPAVQQLAQQMGMPPEQIFDLVSNPSKYTQGDPRAEAQIAEIRNLWEETKEQTVEQLKQFKLQTLVMGGLQANDLDRQMMLEDGSTTCYVDVVKKDLQSVDDKAYPVSDSELKAEWEKIKPMFINEEPQRAIHFIALKNDPSPADEMLAQKVVNQAYAALQRGTGVDSVRLLGTVHIDSTRYASDKLPSNLKSWALGASLGATMKDSTTARFNYKMYKVINKFNSIDSVKCLGLQVVGKKASQDSALNMLKSGKGVEEVAKALQHAQASPEQWMQFVSAPDSLKNRIAAAGEDYFVYDSNDGGAVIMKVTEKKAPKTFYTIATISHDAYPSQKTTDDMRNKLQDFLNKNKTAKAFAENAAKAGFNVQETMVSASTPQLGASPYGGGIKDTRKAIKWAFDAKQGAVSPIFQDNTDYFVAVAVDGVYDGEYLPYDAPNVKEYLTTRVRNAKKADALAKQYQGKAKSIDEYAQLMGAKVDTVKVSFGEQFNPIVEPGLVGRLAVAKPGTTNFFKGENAVYAYRLNKTEKSDRKPSKQELDQQFVQTRLGRFNPINVLAKAANVKRNMVEFF